jgi:hypothetical protein
VFLTACEQLQPVFQTIERADIQAYPETLREAVGFNFYVP